MTAVVTAADRAALARGTCEAHGEEDVLRYARSSDGAMVCAEAIREEAKRTSFVQPCDTAGHEDRRGWRNPFTRRDEYLCGPCHVDSGDGVVQNKWAASVSTPIAPDRRPVCEAKGAVVGSDCRGEVRWRKTAHLCNRHSGRVSAEEPYSSRN